ncbi:MAG: NADH-quinone oxidoreductase subunit M [Bacteroidetes bacterium]|nr:NADH-quinone oxidoreductase subunit M [Bacteroidota bacterium]
MSLYPLFLIGIPLAGAVLLALPVWKNLHVARATGAAVSSVLFLAVIGLLAQFDVTIPQSQFTWSAPWLPQYNLSVSLGVTGLSALLVFLTALIAVAVTVATINRNRTESRWLTVHLLLLTAFLMGVFLSRDMVSFYIFWEATLIPMFFLIGIWGGENRVTANLTFFIFTLAGSLLLLVAILFLATTAGQVLTNGGSAFVTDFDSVSLLVNEIGIPVWVFWFVFIAFGIKAAMFPLHMWLPQTYPQTPIPALVFLSGVMAKMGTYGMILFGYGFMRPVLTTESTLIAVFAMTGILYAAWIAYTRKSLMDVVVFSSMSHMGFIILGLSAGTIIGLQGAAIQMVNHGVSTGAIFLLIGMMENRSSHWNQWSGVGSQAPVLATVFMIAMLSSIGLPGLNGFIGEFNILLGSFNSPWLPSWIAAASAIGVVLAAAYMLLPYRNLFFGQPAQGQLVNDLTVSEAAGLVPLMIMMVWIGIAPGAILQVSLATLNALL